MTTRRLLILVVLGILIGLPAASASAFWTGGGPSAGTGSAGTTSVNRGSTPTAFQTVDHRVSLRWGPSTLSNGLAVDGYEVTRFNATTGNEAATGPGCAGTVAALACTETSVSDGEWQYTVRPVIADNWRGQESLVSGSVGVGSAGIELDESVFGAPLPAVTSGSLFGFDPGIEVVYTLDDGTVLSGSPTTIGPDGTADISSLEIPNLADGPHTVRANVAHSDVATAVDLGSAGDFAVLAGAGVTSAGASTVTGDLGTAPTASVTGFGDGTSGTVNGTIHQADSTAFQAKADLVTAYDETVAQVPAASVATTLGGTTRQPGIYDSASGTFSIAGTLTLDARGDPNAVFIFKTATTLVTAARSNVQLVNGAQACNVFWQVGSSATLGASSHLAGSVMARTAITSGDGVDVDGRLMAQDASITLINDRVTRSPCVEDQRNSASTAILVDTTPPAVSAFVTPKPNAAGWNNSPVRLDASGDDGSGSGIAFLKGTEDGSDPRTSPTAQVWDGQPVPLPVSVPVKYYAADVAGNASEVQTLPVKIDEVAPTFGAEAIDVTGGLFIANNAPPGQPEIVYYRGAADGAFRFQVTVTDPEGTTPGSGAPSGAASLGTSEMTGSQAGWTHAPGVARTPAGGPYLTNMFSWVAGTTSTPTGTLTVSDVAGNRTGGPVSILRDSTAPSGGSVDATGLVGAGGRFSTSTTLNLALSQGTDAGSGLADSGARLMRESADLELGGVCVAYGGSTQIGANDPDPSITDTVPVDDRCYRYTYEVPDHVGNVASFTSPDIKVRASTPASLTPVGIQITPTGGPGSQLVSGSTVYYRPSGTGSFSVSASSSDAFSGVAHVDFPAMTGFTGGGADSTPTGASTFDTTYTWTGGSAPSSPGSQSVSATSNSGNSATRTDAFTVTADDTPPTGGSVDATGLVGTGVRYSTSTTLSLAFGPGTDTGVGLAATGRRLLRSTATLTSDGAANGTCGSFGDFSPVATDPSSPRTDTVPVDGSCYRYRLVVPDRVGNEATYTSPEIKVDTTAPPAPAITFSGLVNASWIGTAVFYRPLAPSGSFTINATSSDTTSGAANFSFPALPSGWTSTPAGTGSQTYSWTLLPSAPPAGLQVTVNNDAGGNSSTGFTVSPTADSTPPSGGSISYLNGTTTNPAMNVSFTKGGDFSGSGVATNSGILQRSFATLSSGTCGAFNAFATVATNPTSPHSDPVTTGCYQYRYLISDNVGNQATYTSASITKVV